jgi:hypothetical protein
VIRAAFSPLERIMLRMLGIRQFLLLQRAGVYLQPEPGHAAADARGLDGSD